MKNGERGRLWEAELAKRGYKKQIASGSQWHSPQDNRDGKFLVQAKATGNKSTSISKKDWIELLRDASKAQLQPLWLIELDGLEIAAMPFSHFEYLLNDEQS